MTATHWGRMARQHWERHLPTRLAVPEDPDAYFEALEDEATAYYAAIRDGMLDSVSPNNGTISWAEFPPAHRLGQPDRPRDRQVPAHLHPRRTRRHRPRRQSRRR